VGGGAMDRARLFEIPPNPFLKQTPTQGHMNTHKHSPLRRAQEAARARGDKTFFHDQPCRNGHTGLRYSASGNCIQCNAIHNRNRYGKSDAERQLKLSIMANCVRTQLSQDTATVADTKAAKDKLLQITGRPVSLSLMHKAGMHLLNTYLSSAPAASSVMALFS
jgi:hypothetical protein